MSDQSTPSDPDGQGAWARPVPAWLGEAIVALTLLAAGLLFMWQAAPLPFGEVGLPGPAFFPFALASVLTLFALAILYRAWRGADDGEAVFLGHRDVLITMAALVCIALAFERADSYVVLGAFTAFMLLFVARAAPWRVILGATLGMVAVWLFFALTLGVRLPTGEFWGQIAVAVTAALFSGQP